MATGVGGYLLYDAYSFYQGPVTDAWDAYDNAQSGDDFDGLYDYYEGKRMEFIQKLTIGGAVTGAGIALAAVSISVHTRAKVHAQQPVKMRFSGYQNPSGIKGFMLYYSY